MWGSLLSRRFTLAQGTNSLRESTPEEKSKLENTYQLKPTSEQAFKPSKVETTMQQVLEDKLKDVKYDPMEISDLSKKLSDKIKSKIKCLGFCRHKMVVYVVIGSLLGQGMELTSRSVWDEHADNCVSARYQNGSIFAVAMMFAIYYE